LKINAYFSYIDKIDVEFLEEIYCLSKLKGKR